MLGALFRPRPKPAPATASANSTTITISIDKAWLGGLRSPAALELLSLFDAQDGDVGDWGGADYPKAAPISSLMIEKALNLIVAGVKNP